MFHGVQRTPIGGHSQWSTQHNAVRPVSSHTSAILSEAPTDLVSVEPRLVHYTPPKPFPAPTDLVSVGLRLAHHASRTQYVTELTTQTTKLCPSAP